MSEGLSATAVLEAVIITIIGRGRSEKMFLLAGLPAKIGTILVKMNKSNVTSSPIIIMPKNKMVQLVQTKQW